MKVFTSLVDPEVIEILNSGGVGVIPTDTVYGLVARVEDEKALTLHYNMKRRKLQPGTMIASSVDQLLKIGFLPDELKLALHYWPGRVSVVLGADNVADYIKVDRQSLAVRIPDSPALLELLEATGPLMTTSANPAGQPTATNLEQIQNYFAGKIDFCVDGGEINDHTPSDIIGFDNDGEMVIYR